MNRKGFTILEVLIIAVVLCVIFVFSIPLVRMVIRNSRFGAFENSVYSAIDAVDVYIVNHEWTQVPEEGLEISVLDESILRNNNFDEGVFVRENGQVRMLYIKQGVYCAKGTKDKLVTTDKGCGALDETKPTKANLFLKNSDAKSVYIVASGYDPDSEIIKYELSVDGGSYYSNNSDKNNVFKVDLDDNKNHKFKVRVTNECGLTYESAVKEFKKDNSHIIIYEKNELTNVQNKKTFTFEKVSNAKYEYSTDLENWIEFKSKIDSFTNQKIYIRETIDNHVRYYTLNIGNIDETLNGAYPELDKNMIPVIYDGNNWIVANKNRSYWDYENGVYANIVLVRKNKNSTDDNSKPRSYYLSDEAIGSPVYEKDIVAFYVWIPRYRYKIWNVAGNNDTGTVEIVFEDKNTEITSGTKNDDWLTHPAFNYVVENGFWISKYQASVATDLNCYLVASINNCNSSAYDIYSLPNRHPMSHISVSNAYLTTKNLNKTFNIYGLTEEVVPHLLTNLEWGALTYLETSKYHSNNTSGVQNIGTKSEYVMGNYNKDSGSDKDNNSGFTPDGKIEWPDTPYIDIYKSISIKGYMLGDATMEINDLAPDSKFISGEEPFMVRGIDNIYKFSNSTGSANSNITFRPVISKVKIED